MLVAKYTFSGVKQNTTVLNTQINTQKFGFVLPFTSGILRGFKLTA